MVGRKLYVPTLAGVGLTVIDRDTGDISTIDLGSLDRNPAVEAVGGLALRLVLRDIQAAEGDQRLDLTQRKHWSIVGIRRVSGYLEIAGEENVGQVDHDSAAPSTVKHTAVTAHSTGSATFR